jgi:membrane-associated phospholipid phosphatase
MKQRIIILFIFFLQQACSQEPHRPYSTRWSIDGPVMGGAIAVALTASSIDEQLPILTPAEIQALNKHDINRVDRFTAGWYSQKQSTVSDILVGGSILSPLLFMFDPIVREDVSTVSIMYLETVIFATFMPSFGKGTVRRVRPYVYSSSAPMSEKQDVDALRSFYSGHATWAFATSIFFATVYTDYHPDSQYRDMIWCGAIGLASAVSILRVTSGAHFLSDIAVGAAVGTSIGYLVPYMHRKNSSDVTLFPLITPDFIGTSLAIRLK